MKRVKRFGVYQTSKVAAIIMFITSFIFLIPTMLLGGFIGAMAGGGGMHSFPMFPAFPMLGGFFIIVLPFVYGLMGFITTAIACVIYNFIAKWTGGIELEFEEFEEGENKG